MNKITLTFENDLALTIMADALMEYAKYHLDEDKACSSNEYEFVTEAHEIVVNLVKQIDPKRKV